MILENIEFIFNFLFQGYTIFVMGIGIFLNLFFALFDLLIPR